MALKDRSTGDLLVLMIAATICLSVIAAGATAAVFKILYPDSDLKAVASALTDVINTLIGLLAGFLAGRTEFNRNEPPKSDNE